MSSTVNPIIIHKRSKVKTEADGLRPASPLTLTQVTCQLFLGRGLASSPRGRDSLLEMGDGQLA